ncbi:MAG: hypothetical protein ACLFNB_03905 [Candidatus Woesearchaeota archaeon]
MELTVYDLETQGLAFKRDFNAFERVKKIHEQRDKTGYLKFDLVTEENGALFLVTRTADFTTNIATMKTEWIRDFTHMPVNLGPYEQARMILSEYDPETSFPEREFQEKLTLFGATREQAREVKFALMREGLIYAPRDGELKRF